MKKSKLIFICFALLTLFAGILILASATLMHGPMATGDHGRDFYAAERTLHGDRPYRDYWWVYGPLMPYYYACFDKAFGVTMTSVLLGKALLKLISGFLIYGTVAVLTGPLAGFTAALWFYVFFTGFAHTHSHEGGIAAVCWVMLSLALYLRSRREKWLWTGLAGAFVLALIKLNFGFAALLALNFTVFLSGRFNPDKSLFPVKRFYLFSLIVFPLAVALAYWPFLQGLSLAEIRQCLPYTKADLPAAYGILDSCFMLFDQMWQGITAHRNDWLLGLVAVFSAARFIFLLAGKRMDQPQRVVDILALTVFGVYYGLNLHEALSGGTLYRAMWAYPVAIVWIFLVISFGTGCFSRVTKNLVFGFLILLALAWQKDVFGNMGKTCDSPHFLSHAKAGVFVSNDPQWVNTVEATTAFLEKNLKPGETFMALPYDPLFYYLTGRKSPTRMLIFFNHINIQPGQERKVIDQIRSSQVRYVVMTNRIRGEGPHLGNFGETYCPLLAGYVQENFVTVARFGAWDKPAGWGENLGTVVLRRKDLWH